MLEQPPLSGAEFFAVLKQSAQRARTPANQEPLRFFGDGFNAQVLEDFARYLPTALDENFESYSKRVASLLGHQEWCIATNNLHRHSPEVWQATREFAHSLFSEIGLAASEISAESFIGPYRSTAAGIHKDKFHIFTFPLVGRKTMLTWPFSSVAKAMGLPANEDLSLQNLVSPFRTGVPGGMAPLVLEADPGDMMYWPPGSWHVGHGRGDFNATLIFTVRSIANAGEWVTKVAPVPAAQLAAQEPTKQTRSRRRHLQQILQTAKTHAKHLTSDDFANRLRDEFDRRRSAVGIEPPVAPITPAPSVQRSDALVADPRFPILMREPEKKSDVLTCYMNGRVLTVAPAQTFSGLIRRLNRGGPVAVDELCRIGEASLRKAGYEAEPSSVLGFLSTCVALRAVTIRP